MTAAVRIRENQIARVQPTVGVNGAGIFRTVKIAGITCGPRIHIHRPHPDKRCAVAGSTSFHSDGRGRTSEDSF